MHITQNNSESLQLRREQIGKPVKTNTRNGEVITKIQGVIPCPSNNHARLFWLNAFKYYGDYTKASDCVIEYYQNDLKSIDFHVTYIMEAKYQPGDILPMLVQEGDFEIIEEE